MSDFMQPEILHGHWYKMDGTEGVHFVWEADAGSRDNLADYYPGKLDGDSVETVFGYGARLSAPGYLDCTDWTVFDTEKEAREHLEEMYDVEI